ncbi:MAG: DUF131 domain-containing protein [Candidatus Bathyarchaeota archaeon]|nr:DUF131 domain-containing protein [Candidatus Termiticorpusculum sp.]
MDSSVLYTVAFLLIAFGILLVVVSILVLVGKSCDVGGEGCGRVRGAGVIMIGPIPIIFGTDKKSVKTVLVFALALTVAFVVWYYLMLR